MMRRLKRRVTEVAPTAVLTAVLTVVLTALCGSGSAQQYRILPRRLLDSVANPVTAAESPMRFERTRADIGTVSEDDAPCQCEFRWRNCGEEPLVVTDVQTGCGCVTADYDRRPVMKGEESVIRVTFRPKGHPGWLLRKVSVFTQASAAPSAVLELTGSVTASSMPSYAYRYAFGPLRLKQTRVRTDVSRRGTESIEVLNTGADELFIRVDSTALPRYVTVECRPQRIESGGRADIEIGFDPAQAAGELPDSVPIVLEGLLLPPGERTIYLLLGADGD